MIKSPYSNLPFLKELELQIRTEFFSNYSVKKSDIAGGQANFFFLRQTLTLSPGWSAVAWFQLIAISASWVQAIPLPQPPK